MRASLKWMFTALLAVVLTGPAAFAQQRPSFMQAELDQMLAPVALYPDSLLSQILMAATYPLEVVQAARWTRSNPHLKGEDAVRAVEMMDWDPSVKSLVAFPQVVQRMDEHLDWTERLGEAFIVQEPQVMETIQALRQRAAAAGNLGQSEHMRVMHEGEHILIEPAGADVVYVPYYNPMVVYGPWWWPAYPPIYWGPWPGYYVSGYAPTFLWGSGVAIRIGFFFGHFDWPHRHVLVFPHHHRANVHVDRHITGIHRAPVRWQHDPRHRRGIPFRHAERRHEQRHIEAPDRNVRPDYRAPGAAPLTQPRVDNRSDGVRGERRGLRPNSGFVRDGDNASPRQFAAPSNDLRMERRARGNFDRDARTPLSAPTHVERRADPVGPPYSGARSAPQTSGPVMAPPVVPPSPAPRADARHGSPAFGGEQQIRSPTSAPAPVARNALERRGAERAPALPPQPTINAPVPRGDARAAGAMFDRGERHFRGPAPAPVVRSALDRREFSRPPPSARADAPSARPFASYGRPMAGAGGSPRHAEARGRGERRPSLR